MTTYRKNEKVAVRAGRKDDPFYRGEWIQAKIVKNVVDFGPGRRDWEVAEFDDGTRGAFAPADIRKAA